MAPQNVKITLQATDDTQQARSGLDALEKKIEALEKAWLDVGKKAGDSSKKVIDATDKQQKSLFSLNSTLKTIGGGIAGYFAVDALIGFGKQILAVTSEFQKFEAVLTNTFGSNDRALVAMQLLQDKASELPVSLQELTGAYLKLVNNGIEPTSKEITAFVDVASNAGKGIDEFAEAINDATRGEFERLKEFFIDASKQGDKVIFTFKGQRVEVDNNAKAIKNYLASLGQLPGVMGASEKIAQTLSGRISNLGDSFDKLLNVFGQRGEGVITQFIDLTKRATDALIDFFQTGNEKDAEQFSLEVGKALEKTAADFDTNISALEKTGVRGIDAIKQAAASMNAELQIQADKASKVLSDAEDLAISIQAKFSDRGFFGNLLGEGEEEMELANNRAFARREELQLIIQQQKEIARLAQIKLKEKEADKPLEKDLKKEAQAKLKQLEADEAFAIRRAKLSDQSENAIERAILRIRVNFLDKKQAILNLEKNQYKDFEVTKEELEKAFTLKRIERFKKEYKTLQDVQKDFDLGLLTTPEKVEEETRIQDEFFKKTKAKIDKGVKDADNAYKQDVENKKFAEDKKAALIEESFNLQVLFIDALFQIGRDRNQKSLDDSIEKRDAELKRVGDDKQAQAFINAKFDREEAKLKTKQAIADKAASLFQIAIKTAQGVLTYLSNPVTAPLVPLVVAAGAIQSAVVAARPIPKYAKGEEYIRRLNGEKPGRDTILAYLDEGERVVPRDINRQMMGIQNSELPMLAAQYRQDTMSRGELREILKAQKEMIAVFKNHKTYQTVVDKDGVKLFVKSQNASTRILNEQFTL